MINNKQANNFYKLYLLCKKIIQSTNSTKLIYDKEYIYSLKNLFCKLSFGQRPRQCLNKSYSNRI